MRTNDVPIGAFLVLGYMRMASMLANAAGGGTDQRLGYAEIALPLDARTYIDNQLYRLTKPHLTYPRASYLLEENQTHQYWQSFQMLHPSLHVPKPRPPFARELGVRRVLALLVCRPWLHSHLCSISALNPGLRAFYPLWPVSKERSPSDRLAMAIPPLSVLLQFLRARASSRTCMSSSSSSSLGASASVLHKVPWFS